MSTAILTENETLVTESETRIKADKARIDRLKEQLRSTPQDVIPSGSGSWRRFMRIPPATSRSSGAPNFSQRLLERKKLYIDDNLFVGSMASSVNAVYTYPEWRHGWMKEENTVEKSKTPEDRKANEWALEYWDKRANGSPGYDEIFEKTVWL